MRRGSTKWIVQRAAIGGALIAVLSAFSCEETQDATPPDERSDVGGLSLGVELADGLEVENVRYSLKLVDQEVRSGVMPVAADGTASATEANLEPRSGYRVDLSAEKKVRERCRAVSSPFAVKAGLTTTVPVTFQCDELPTP